MYYRQSALRLFSKNHCSFTYDKFDSGGITSLRVLYFKKFPIARSTPPTSSFMNGNGVSLLSSIAKFFYEHITFFTDYYEHMIYEFNPHPSVIENVREMLQGGDLSYVGIIYSYSHCDNLKFVPFRCHNRFCPACSNKYNQLRPSIYSINPSLVSPAFPSSFFYSRYRSTHAC